MENNKKDFTFSLSLILIGLYVTVEGLRMYKKASQPPYNIETLSISPAFLPMILGVVLVLLSVILFAKSLKGTSFNAQLKVFSSSLQGIKGNQDMKTMFVGTLILAIYTFLLMAILPFWIASILFLTALMFYLKAGKFWKILLISALSIGAVVLLFQVGFNAALP
jgi:hypothetical protein